MNEAHAVNSMMPITTPKHPVSDFPAGSILDASDLEERLSSTCLFQNC